MPPEPTEILKTSCTPDLLYIFGVSLRTSHRLALRARPTPENLTHSGVREVERPSPAICPRGLVNSCGGVAKKECRQPLESLRSSSIVGLRTDF